MNDLKNKIFKIKQEIEKSKIGIELSFANALLNYYKETGLEITSV